MTVASGRRNAPPHASSLIESLRGLGYNLGTALADIIDNSITSGAAKVDIAFAWNGRDSWISILDDGVGMTDGELEKAMQLGDRNPLQVRAENDLGRFGLGLKTASFSQCRRLTVASRRGNQDSCLRWDLDVLASSSTAGDWDLLEGADPASGLHTVIPPMAGSGTVVIWDVLDRIVTQGATQQNFLDQIDRVEQHLSMVFHRFLDGSGHLVQITINGKRIEPWDPFLTSHPATWSSLPVRVKSAEGHISMQGFVLPHKDKLSSGEYERAAGPGGWTSQQGFYVYRNRRLLVAGSWLGLGRGRPWTKEEPQRLARICLDIPNSADAEWKIDIRKSSARPPLIVRDRVIRLGEDVRDRARRVFAHRGQQTRKGSSGLIAQVWRAEHFAGGMRYRVDRDHPAVLGLLEEPHGLGGRVEAMLRMLEETIPVQRIWLDTVEKAETPRTGFAEQPAAEVYAILQVLYRNLVLRKGLSSAGARRQLLHTEPFHLYPQLVEALPDFAGSTQEQA